MTEIAYRPGCRAARKVMAALSASAVFFSTGTLAQTIEDHSLPKSSVKTYHIKCSEGRLGKVRYDTRVASPQICASVQDGSKRRKCISTDHAHADEGVRVLARWVCE